MSVGCYFPCGYLPKVKVEDLVWDCAWHLKKNSMTGAEAASLRGRLQQHGKCSAWGRYGCAALRPLDERQRTARFNVLNPSLRAALCFWIRALRDGGHRPVPLIDSGTVLHITIGDGEGTGSIAAAYLRPRDEKCQVQMAQMHVPSEYRQYWQ